MPHAMRIHEHGGPEKLRWEDVQVPAPGEGEVRVRNTAIGLNYIDTYQRSGLYPMQLPFTPGSEGAGVVEAVGSAPRAVGRACGRNPIPIVIPCHRVLAKSGLGGYSGQGGLATKTQLLALEGALLG